MLHISEELQKKIENIAVRIRDAERTLKETDVLNADQAAQISFSCTEIALLAFAASDELNEEAELGDRLLQREISALLWSVAIHCVEIQTWQSDAVIRANVEYMGRQCTSVISMTGLSEPYSEETPVSRAPEALRVAGGNTGMQTLKPPGGLQTADPEEAALIMAPPPEDQIRRLKAEVKALKELLASLVLKRDSLLLVEIKELDALYMKELGYLELEIYREESKARYLQRKYEMMQAAVNRQEPIDTAEIEKKLSAQYEEFKKTYEEFRKKAAEAEESVRKRRQNAKDAADGLGKESARGNDEKDRLPPGEEPDPDDDDGIREQGAGRLKKIYRKIVKALHPDLHPDQDEKMKELFKRAMAAYEEGDLLTLEEIAHVLENDEPENPEDLLKALLKEKERLLGLIHGIRAQITLILGRFPFTWKEVLKDPVRLKSKQEELKKRLERAKKRSEVYRQRIEELEKNGRPDHQTE
ncbi:MAG: hypothetical protein K5746_02885 [Clostridiales bacterium]|nr:hypothetical protein [Clostridiales bacterium]